MFGPNIITSLTLGIIKNRKRTLSHRRTTFR